MKIIIVGIGKLGEYLAKCLVNDLNEVTLIDESLDSKNNIINNEDLNYICGSGLNIEILKSAGIENADLLISAMDTDEKNVMCSLLGRKLGVKHTIARIRSVEYRNVIDILKDELGLSMILNPESLTASNIAKILSIPSALDAQTFFKGRIEMISFKIKKDDKFCGLSINSLSKKINIHFIVCAILRKNETIIPTGKTELEDGDKIYIAGKVKEINEVLKYGNLIKNKPKKVIISGASSIAVYLCNILSDLGMNVILIEMNKERCDELSEKLNDCMIINADSSNENVLLEEGIDKCDAFISLNNIDEENIVYSMYASKFNVPKIFTKINHIHLNGIENEENIGTVVTPHKIAANQIVKYVRAMKSSADTCESVYQFDDKFEMVEFNVKEGFNGVNIKLKDLKLKTSTLITAILRNRQIIFPSGEDVIKINDTIIVTSKAGNIKAIKDILV